MAELAWGPGGSSASTRRSKRSTSSKLYVNDRNTDAAPAYAVMNARVGFAQTRGQRDVARIRARSTTFSTATTSGSVIVGDTNGRYFEPAPGRNWFVGASVDVRL